MLTVDTLTRLQETNAIPQAAAAVDEGVAAKFSAVALPEHMKLRDLENFMPTRRRLKGTLRTSSQASFIYYCQIQREQEASVFVHGGALTATAVLNFGSTDAPGHADNLAHLTYECTAAYAALRHMHRSDPSQKEVAEWMEDWSEHITCFVGDEEVALARAVAAVRRVSIEHLNKVETTVEQLGAERTAFESVKASSKLALPTVMHFKCTPSVDLPERLFVLRLAITPTDEGPRFTLRIKTLERHEQEMAKEVVDQLTAAFGSEISVYVGSYTTT